MKFIEKHSEPKDFINWKIIKKKNKDDVNYNYNEIPSEIRLSILQSLLEEQGFICAYTGKEVGEKSSHIEHLFPRTHCTKGQEDVDYNNMVACYPSKNAKGRSQYGAHEKDSWPAKEEWSLFVSPLNKNCESKFKYISKGEILPAINNDDSAKITIDKLNLNHKELKTARAEAYKSATEKLNLEGAKRKLRQIMQFKDKRLEPFCFVKKQALERFIKMKAAIEKDKAQKK